MTTHRTIAQVLDAAEQTLELARQGWRDYLDAGARRYGGLTTAIVNARSVTNVLQNARGMTPDFDPWWTEHVRVLDNDIAKWFVTVRNRIEKQGTLGETSPYVSAHIDSNMMDRLQRIAPPGTVGTWIGDELGRNGWDVQLADGTIQQVFFTVPKERVTAILNVHDAPDGRPIEELFPLYLAQVEQLVQATRERFGS